MATTQQSHQENLHAQVHKVLLVAAKHSSNLSSRIINNVQLFSADDLKLRTARCHGWKIINDPN